nr:LuxR C-terminal-related transcriptional regulator [Streptomyces sp. NBC_00974]
MAQLDASVMTRLAAALVAPEPTAPGPAGLGPGHTAPDVCGHRPPGPVDALTGREVDVPRLVAGGSTNREIATRLYLGEGTVKDHISRILGRTRAAPYARGLL